MKKIRLAVIGAGAIGRKHIAVIRAHPRAELVALGDPSPHAQVLAQSLNIAGYDDVEAILDVVQPPDHFLQVIPGEETPPIDAAAALRSLERVAAIQRVAGQAARFV